MKNKNLQVGLLLLYFTCGAFTVWFDFSRVNFSTEINRHFIFTNASSQTLARDMVNAEYERARSICKRVKMSILSNYFNELRILGSDCTSKAYEDPYDYPDLGYWTIKQTSRDIKAASDGRFIFLLSGVFFGVCGLYFSLCIVSPRR